MLKSWKPEITPQTLHLYFMYFCIVLEIAQLLLGIKCVMDLWFVTSSSYKGHSVNEKSTLSLLSLMWQTPSKNKNPSDQAKHFQSSSLFFPMRLCLHKKCGIWDAVMFPAGAHTPNAVYFAELMAASLNQHVGGWRAACTPKFIWFPFRSCTVH